MIVKMTILRLLGSSDDKEKICIARPEAEKITYVGALTWSTPGILVSPVEPTLGKLNTSVQCTQKLRQGLYTG